MSETKRDPEFNYLLPLEECEMIYRILGREPDLDPCGHPDQILKAGTILYGDPDNDDGMTAQWARMTSNGLVVLNAAGGEYKPDHVDINFKWHPFSKWIRKASAEAARGATILAFLPASTDRKWFHEHLVTCTSMCFLQKRVRSWLPINGELKRGDQPKNPHMYALWTKDFDISERFFKEMEVRGFVAEPNPVPDPLA